MSRQISQRYARYTDLYDLAVAGNEKVLFMMLAEWEEQDLDEFLEKSFVKSGFQYIFAYNHYHPGNLLIFYIKTPKSPENDYSYYQKIVLILLSNYGKMALNSNILYLESNKKWLIINLCILNCFMV